jgi:hypothetical protein
MSDLETVHLKLPYIAAAQAQKHVTHNEALRLLDTVVQLAVLDTTLAEPPADPGDGDRYIVAAGATDAWEGRDGKVATWVDGAWEFAAPADGWLAFDLAAEILLVCVADEWTPVSTGGGGTGSFDELGVNAAADATNRLAVRSAAVLFSGIEVADGGTGDIRFTVNKEADADTASLLFQSGFSGRAEVGLAGDTDFVFKVSPDGSAWVDAIRIDKDTGHAEILYDNTVSGLAATTVQEAIDEVAAGGGGGGGAVASVFGRTGAVAASGGDYDAGQIDNDSGVGGASVKDALDALAATAAGKQVADADLTAVAALSSTGIAVRSAADTWVVRSIAQPAAGITVANASGAGGNPTLALANDLAAVEGLSATGLAARTAADTWAARAVAGTTNRVTLTNGDGVAGNPTVDISSSYVGQTSITTLGTVGTGVWQGTAVGVAYGGTGQSSYTNGQLLIGNTTGSTLAKATLTAPAAGVTITNGAGSITFGLANDLAAVEGLSATGLAARTAADTWTARSVAGTTNRITLTNGDGVAGNPTVDISSSYVGQTSITTLGTVGTGTWQGTAVGVAYGGTGQSSYTNGQLLIGNTTGSTLAKATLTAPAAGVTITNGAGSITFGLANDLAALEGLGSTGIAVRTGADAWAQRSVAAGTNVQVTNGDGVSGDPTIASTATAVNTQTASYTLVLADAGKVVEMNVGSANNLTVPPNSSVAFPTGTFVNLGQYGAGATTIVAGAGVTIRNRNGLALGGQYAVATLYKRGTDEWVAGGDLKT